MKKKTIVYIDGFNFYYSFLKGTPCKWLDIEKILSKLLEKDNEILEIKYFTADVSNSKFDKQVAYRQRAYFSALQILCPKVELIKGMYKLRESSAPLRKESMVEIKGFTTRKKIKIPLENQEGLQEEEQKLVRIIKQEEKGSDVNLAVHMLNDAWLDKYECAVIISNDSDITESLALIKKYHKDKIIGVVCSDNPGRELIDEYKPYIDFSKTLKLRVIKKYQMPNNIPNSNIKKPESW